MIDPLDLIAAFLEDVAEALRSIGLWIRWTFGPVGR